MSMEQLIMKIFNLFIAPLLVIFLPLQMAIITLGIFFLINVFVQMLLSIRRRKVPYWRIDRYIDDELIEYILKSVTSYAFTIFAVSVFEVHVIGLQAIEVAGQFISLTRAIVVLATAQQLGRAMNGLEHLTGFKLFNVLLSIAPQWLKDIFNHKDIYNNTDSEISNDFNETEQSIDDDDKTS